MVSVNLLTHQSSNWRIVCIQKGYLWAAMKDYLGTSTLHPTTSGCPGSNTLHKATYIYRLFPVLSWNYVSGKLPQEKPWNSELVLTLEKGKGKQFRNQIIQKWKEESNVCHQQPIWQNSVDPPNESQDIRQSSGYQLIIDQLSWFSPDFYKLSVRFI